MLSDNERWVLSYYRGSEIAGAMFFARLAKSIRQPAIQRDLTRHFADESQHAWYWTECLQALGATPIRVVDAYQDQYFDAVGVPANLMEVLAITQVFERRTIAHYAKHKALPNVHPLVRDTVDRIMADEGWHLSWVTQALTAMEPEYGRDYVRATLRRFRQADETVYRETLREHGERTSVLAATTDPR